MWSRLAYLLLAGLLAAETNPGPASAQPGYEAEFASLVSDANALTASFPASSSGSDLARRVKRDAEILRAKYINGRQQGEVASADYVRTVQYDRDAMRQSAAAAASGDQASAIALARDALSDLDVKVSHARAGAGIGESLGIYTNLSIQVLRNGSSVNGLTYSCNPYHWRTSATAMFSVSPPTSVLRIPPGRYRVLVSENGRTLKTVDDVLVGTNGETQQQLQIKLP